MNQIRNKKMIGKEAVVIGASIGGILAARALSDSFERVTIIERDSFPEPGEQRKGVPQGRHAHGLLASGLAIMEEAFPGMSSELVEQGAITGSATKMVRWHLGGAYHLAYESNLIGMNISRPLLEAHLRERLIGLPNVRALSRCDVLGLQTSADRSQVRGVRILNRRDGSVEEVLEADLVVDATGRGSRSPAWLEALGFERAPEEIVRIDFSYTSRVYRRDPVTTDQFTGIISAATQENRRAGVLLAMEGSRWIVTLGGYMGESAPPDEAGFLAYARTLNSPDIAEVILKSEPLTEPVQFKYPSSQRRRYELLKRFPTGYLVFGDAICSFNPIYGQGMSVAAQESVVLRECLEASTEGLALRFFERAAKVIDIPWNIAVGTDLRYPDVQGPRTKQTNFINWYLDQLHVAARKDQTVSHAFHRVLNLLAPPESLMHPRIITRIIRARIFPARQKRPAAQESAQAA